MAVASYDIIHSTVGLQHHHGFGVRLVKSFITIATCSVKLCITHRESVCDKKVDSKNKVPRNKEQFSFIPLRDKTEIIIYLQITGGAGFVGSHLTDKLMLQGHEVTVVDNFFTGRKRNVEHWIGHENFELINHDIVNPLFIEGALIFILIIRL